MINSVKGVIQKEEYISIAVNKYILQTGTIPKTSTNSLDWDKLLTQEYLGEKFNKINPLTNNEIQVNFDENNNMYLKGVIETDNQYTIENNYLYNFYANRIFRVNTIVPENITKDKLLIGAQVSYGDVQRQIVEFITTKDENKSVKLINQACPVNKYFYELNNGKLTYKYCLSNYSLEVYQESPIYLENLENLEDINLIRGNIGDKAFVKYKGMWYEYYYQGDSEPKWAPAGMADTLTGKNDDSTFVNKVLSYIPDSKDLLLRRDGGCMLANGDIFCWGNNKYKKSGIESFGQLDNTLTPDYVNIPVMLKVQIDNLTIDSQEYDLKSKNWYNNPYRVKFEKMALNSTNVCGISPIFTYYENGINKKIGGDLYCNGQLNYQYFEDLTSVQIQTSILKRNKFFYWGKSDQRDDAPVQIKESEDGGPAVYASSTSSVEKTKLRDEIYLVDLVMVEDTVAVLSDEGKIYTYGVNYKGALGIGSDDIFEYYFEPVEVKNTGQFFKKIFALRDIKGFGAIDSNNYFYIWGESSNGTINNKPKLLSDSMKFNPDGIFVNSKDFVLKSLNNKFYRTKDNSISELTEVPSNAISVTLYDHSTYGQQVIYVDENMQLKGNNRYLSCKNSDGTDCNQSDKDIFNVGLNELNTPLNIVNGRNYANFANVSIFQLDYNIQEIKDTWENFRIYDGGASVTKFLGRFGEGEQTSKDYDFGIANANQNVTVTLTFYEIGTWDGENFIIYLNNIQKHNKTYYKDSLYMNLDLEGTGVTINGINTPYQDEKHTITISGTTDNNGRLNITMKSSLSGDISKKSWGVDDIKITKNSNNSVLKSENFDSSEVSDWILKTYSDNNFSNLSSTSFATTYNPTETVPDTTYLPIIKRVNPGTILGRFLIGKQSIEKTYDFGSTYSNYGVEVEIDFFEIDSWDMERFQIFFNDTLVSESAFIHDCHSQFSDTNDSGVYTLNLGTHYNAEIGICPQTGEKFSKYNDEKYTYKLKGKLDNSGKLKIMMRTRELKPGEYGYGDWSYGQVIDDESWGVNNIKVKLKETNKTFICGMTGLSTSSQMYCWGDVNRSIPILSTSLYDISKINNLNKLFITQDVEKKNQMTFNDFYYDGKFWLKFPVYISGFDYPFYFK